MRLKIRLQTQILTVVTGLLMTSAVSSAASVKMMDYFYPIVEGASWYYSRTGAPKPVAAVRVKVEDPDFELRFNGNDHGLKIRKSRVVAKISSSVTRSSKGNLDTRLYWPESHEYYGTGNKFSIYGTDDDRNTDYFRFTKGIEFPAKVQIGKAVTKSSGLLGHPYQAMAPGGWRLGPGMKWKTVVMGKSTITVPAGVFKNCIHVRHTVTVGESAGEVADEWWAKGVGKVRVKYTGNKKSSIVEDLIHYTIPTTVAPLEVADVTVRTPFDLSGPFDFGTVSFGQPPAMRTFTVKNTGTATIVNLKASSTDPSFRTKDLTIPLLAPGEKVKIHVKFQPKESGKIHGKLRLQMISPSFLPYEVPMTGFGEFPWD